MLGLSAVVFPALGKGRAIKVFVCCFGFEIAERSRRNCLRILRRVWGTCDAKNVEFVAKGAEGFDLGFDGARRDWVNLRWWRIDWELVVSEDFR